MWRMATWQGVDTVTESPTAQRRRLGRLLRSLREQARMTGEEAAAAAERSASWLSRIESGRAALRLRELRDLLDHYGMTDPARRASLEQLANGGRQRGWWSDFADSLTPSFIRFIGLESESTEMLTFEDHAMPGLLQCRAYMRALFRLAVPPLSVADLEDLVEVRSRRQEVLHNDGRPHFAVILDEAVLLRRIGSRDVEREQLTFLLDAIDRQLVEFRVLTKDRERMPLHGFTILRFPEDPTVVYLDTLSGGALEEGQRASETYESIWAYLQTVALDPSSSRRVIENAKDFLE